MHGTADSDDEGGGDERLTPRTEPRRGRSPDRVTRDRSVAWLDGRARSPAPSDPLGRSGRVSEVGDILTRTDTGEKWWLSAAADALRDLGAPPELCVRWALLRTSVGLEEQERCPYLDCPSHMHRSVHGFRPSARRVDNAGTNAEHNRLATGRERSPARVGNTGEERGRGTSRNDRRSRSRSAERSPRREGDRRSSERRSASRSPGRTPTGSGTRTAAAPAATKPSPKPAAKVTR